MAPKGGGSSGGGGGSSSSSSSSSSGSSSSGGDDGYPSSCGATDCTVPIEALYTAAFIDGKLYGQTIVYGIWALVLLFLICKAWNAKSKLLMTALFSWLAVYILRCVRYGLIIGRTYVRIEYLFESPVTLLLCCLGSMALFTIVARSLAMPRGVKIGFWIVFAAYALLYLADTGLYFHTSAQDYVDLKAGRLYMSRFDENVIMAQVRVDVATGVLEVCLALLIIAAVAIEWVTRRSRTKRGKICPAVAAVGLLLHALFALVVIAAFDLYNYTAYYSDSDEPHYRKTVAGYPIVQAVLPPLGIVAALAAMVSLARDQGEVLSEGREPWNDVHIVAYGGHSGKLDAGVSP